MVGTLVGGGTAMIPLLAVGMIYYRYLMADPEAKPIDVPQVSLIIFLSAIVPYLNLTANAGS